MSSSTTSIEEATGVAAAVAVGNDDARLGTHSFVVSGTTFQVDSKYKFIKPIGHGAYGVVISAQNTETGDKVAIKKVSKAFEDLIDAKRILREIKLLQHFDHENIITIVDLLPPPSLALFEDVYIISDLMETDLHRIIYSRQPLSDDHIQYFLYQILRALKYIHSSNVLHRDLKPSNLLLNSNCDLKVCDFGLARGVEPDEDNMELTEYVVTRWYRAPEIMLSTKEYTKAIDIWSTGCIFAELLGRKPMFPGDDYIHQLQIICDKLGTPTEDELHFVTSEKARRFMKSQPNKPKIPLDRLFPNVKPNALDLLDKMLVFDPSKRISVEEALQHPYLESLHNSDDEPKSTKPFSFEFEKENLTKRRLQELIAEEVCHFHPHWRDQRQATSSPDLKLATSSGSPDALDGVNALDDC
ncbi:CMGC/MAPK protein kinase [Aphanomyces astaci]|uniref:Mitogen-activated protein kinase n=2 Tax=Aphanomyces astaci TaxID=112090 RepID=W4H5S3_APHAT|nr:CMGC/MAPK protein kinase [Aphanomyces astaci]ETV86594.1 CMGC/MAPK protein kinase [Aphanomyces astaci]|eukprot:XP_009823393.1 CMGC/MAPK protein kinase [Aphanomyces astaci]